ncbi:hypothetical protein HGP17_28020 [Rhizobium sp. P38BS-XIX]|uniref:hypothetical protein n=1 Tax=Rhizobium sp. P38BS-XIX TaxID=2726740 RepID=UPI00145645B5|nr:hypothetical protein [Rhizobium sp. P38BS-XIX]NLS00694.1 hypothetical protein [Rhizobium sp. P38BS-XIX]
MKIIDRTARHFIIFDGQEVHNVFEILLLDLRDIRNRIDECNDEHILRAIDKSYLMIKELYDGYTVVDDPRYCAAVFNAHDLITALRACINIAEKMLNQ